MRSLPVCTRSSASVAVISLMLVLPASPAAAQATPDTIISVCSGVSLPPSVVTSIIDPVVTGIYAPIESKLNGTLAALSVPLLNIAGLPAPLSVNVNGLLTTAANGSNITLQAIASDGTLIGPGDPCNAQADSYTLASPRGVSIGGNAITGLGASGQEAIAGEINSIAIGNRARTNALALNSLAIGADASVGAGGLGSIALGRGSSVTVANSVALGAGSVASRGAQAGSAGEVSVGAAGAFRQITNVADGTAASDAATVGQLQAIAASLSGNAVQYSDSSNSSVVLAGAGGTTVSNVAAGAVTASSSDAVNGSQLFATNQQIAGNATAITALQGDVSVLKTNVAGNSAAITTLQGDVSNLQTDVAGNSTAITNLQSDVGNLQTNVAGNSAAISNLEVSVAGNSSAIANLETNVAGNNTAITNLQSNLAVTNVAVSNLQTSVGAVEAAVTSNTTAITNLQVAVDGNSGAITNLQTAVNSNSAAITNLATNVTGNTTAITNLQTSVGGNTTAINTLSVSVANQGADIGALQESVVDVRADLDALAQTVSELDFSNSGPVRYSNADTPTLPNGGTPTNDVTLVGAASGPVQLHNVAAGVVAAGSTDAVNGGQLAITDVAVAAAQQTANQALQVGQNAVAYDGPARSSVTLGGAGASQAVQLRNVAAGTLGTDAVNLNQVRDLADNALRSANNYTDQRLAAFSFDLGEARKEARAGAAAALAAAGMPQAMDAGANMIAAGIGTYGGRAAVAIGGSHRTENGKAVFRIGVTYDSSSKVGASGGAGIQF